jgi:seryl-tRNA synthetase
MDMTITAGFFASLSIVLFMWAIRLHKKNERIEHEHETAVAERDKFAQQLTDADKKCEEAIQRAIHEKDEQIKRQQKQIEELHNALTDRPNVSGGGAMG